MDLNLTIVNSIKELARLNAAVESGARTDDVAFWEMCEESSSAMLATLNEELKGSLPTDEFKNAFKYIHSFNLMALARIASCEQEQRGGKFA